MNLPHGCLEIVPKEGDPTVAVVRLKPWAEKRIAEAVRDPELAQHLASLAAQGADEETIRAAFVEAVGKALVPGPESLDAQLAAEGSAWRGQP